MRDADHAEKRSWNSDRDFGNTLDTTQRSCKRGKICLSPEYYKRTHSHIQDIVFWLDNDRLLNFFEYFLNVRNSSKHTLHLVLTFL